MTNEITQATALVVKERQEFAGRETQAIVETASTAAAAQARAAVESRYVMALRRPRDWDDVRAALLKECRRPSFAAVARYHKPIGRGIEGPSIRFAEAALRCMGNAMPESFVVYDDEERRIVRVSVTDLEANVTYTRDVTIDKTVERRDVKHGDTVLRSRLNKNNQKVYLIVATEDDLLNKESALISKAMRTCALRVVPGDIVDECMDLVLRVQRDESARDPDAQKKNACDAWAAMGVKPSALKEYLGHPIEQATTDELVELRALYAAIRDGEATWTAAMESRMAERDGAEKPQATHAPAAVTTSRTGALAAKLGGNGPQTTAAPPFPPAETRKPVVKPAAESKPPAPAKDDGVKYVSDPHPDWPCPPCPDCNDAGTVTRTARASKAGHLVCESEAHGLNKDGSAKGLRFWRASDDEVKAVTGRIAGIQDQDKFNEAVVAFAAENVPTDHRQWAFEHAETAKAILDQILGKKP